MVKNLRFLFQAMEVDAVGSRKEPGCLRFDVIEGPSTETSGHFTFYEVYKTEKDIEFHRKQDHFKVWSDFKELESKPVISLSVLKGKGIYYGQ